MVICILFFVFPKCTGGDYCRHLHHEKRKKNLPLSMGNSIHFVGSPPLTTEKTGEPVIST